MLSRSKENIRSSVRTTTVIILLLLLSSAYSRRAFIPDECPAPTQHNTI